jgi:hypothetical protein
MSMLGVAAGLNAAREQVWYSTAQSTGGQAYYTGTIFSAAMGLIAAYAVWKLIRVWREG